MPKLKLIKKVFNILIFLNLFGCTLDNEEKYYINNLGLNLSQLKSEFDYNEPSSQSEDFQFKVLHFTNNKSELKFSTKFPKLDSTRKNWNIFNWTRTNSKNEYTFLDVLFTYKSSDLKLKSKIDELKEAIKSDNNFYCYYFKKEGNLIYSIDFYLIDLKSNLIYNILIIT